MAHNYRDKDLRGRNFAEQNLTNADFRGADVSGADFSGANLTGARFSPSKKGKTRALGANFHKAKLLSTNFTDCDLQMAVLTEATCGPRWQVYILRTLCNFLLLFLFNYIVGVYSGVMFLVLREDSQSLQIGGTIGIIFVVVIYVTILFKGIKSQILIGLGIGVGLVVMIAGGVADPNKVAIVFLAAVTVAVIAAFVAASATNLFVFYFAWRTPKTGAKFSLLHDLGVSIGLIGSTCFLYANLVETDFSATRLHFADFRHTNLNGVNWVNAQELEQAKFDSYYLNTSTLCQLAVNHDGRGQVYDGLNLSGLNLAGAQLQGASFVSANLNHVNLQAADLSEAVLKQTQLDGANLSAANLSGATIEDWGITVNTQLDDIRCTHVYMRAAGAGVTNRLRKPDNENEVFAEGEFAEFIRPLTDTLDLYHSQGVDPRAMSAAIKHMSERHPEAEPQIVAMERRGQHGFNVRVQVTPEADKSALSADYFGEYKQFKALAEAEKQTLMARLEEKDSRIVSLENMISLALQPQRYYDDPEAGLPASARALVPRINTHFSLEEVEGLCFEMGIDDENLRGQTKIAKIRTLVKHCHRTATLEALKQHMLAQRPNLRDQLGG